MKRIDEMFAFVCIDENGDEGVPAIRVGEIAYPLVGADMARIESLRSSAQAVANMTKSPVHLVKFRAREEMETINPIPPI